MKLSDLLTELRENILHDRSNRVEGSPDYLWSDETLIRYINEAQRRFARKGLVLRDGTSTDAARVTLQTDVSEYPLHVSVLGVISARLTSDAADLARAGHAAFDTYRQPDPYFFDPSQLSSLPPGKPLAYGTDEYLSADDDDSLSRATLRVYPAPTATYNNQVLRLRVVRLPLEDLASCQMNAVPEIPEDHHLEMLDWAAYLALRIVDIDAGAPARAAEFRSSFEDHVKQARNSAMRKMFTPMQWGFGRNAWSWES
tara:strand:+ start:1648 stop:2415 length:768 start_codon:yes stop_codon:yes gene_type:complete